MRRLTPHLLAAALIAVPLRAGASEIWPLAPVHEAMTVLAYRCAEEAGDRPPTDCRTSDAALSATTNWWRLKSPPDRIRAVTWPDDPLRQIRSFSVGSFLIDTALGGCGGQGSDPDSPAFAIADRGLLCSSHFGSLQFLHAMRSARNERTEHTRARVLDWATFTYRVAAGEVRGDAGYCAYFRNSPSSISGDLAPADFPFCNDRVLDGRRYGGWRISTLFTLHCRDPFDPSRCTERGGAALARTNARGALLHVVQDSYSRSHVHRGRPAEDRFEPRVDCLPPLGFYFYGKDNADAHKAADAVPAFDVSCRSEARTTDDVITASARLIWMLDHDVPSTEARAYLEERVFGRSSGS